MGGADDQRCWGSAVESVESPDKARVGSRDHKNVSRIHAREIIGNS